jgi:ketosteroid isomerase-like protein
MSAESIEVVREIYRRWTAGEPAGDLISQDLEYVNPPYAVESGTRRGRRALASIREVYPDFRVEPERFLDAGEDVVVIGTAKGTSASGLEASWAQGYVWTVRDGVAVRFQWFNQPQEALRAAGLDPAA